MTIMAVREKAGCWAHERWRMEVVLRCPALARHAGLEWPDLHNRNEQVTRGDGRGRVCQWMDSSWLTAARVFPRAGGRLLGHCLKEWPVVLGGRGASGQAGTPDISVLLPFSGVSRLGPLRTVVESLAGQTGATAEILVIEEGERSILPPDLCTAVNLVFLHRPAGAAYCKSRMLNAGAAVARGRHLLLHDADVVVPSRYLEEIVRCLDAGVDGVRPLRFLFCLDEGTSRLVQETRELSGIGSVRDVMQNFPGGSVGVRRDVFERLGGMDERFQDWGGEDLEFLDRLKTCRLFEGAWMPGVHLWHDPAGQKRSGHRNLEAMRQIRSIPAEQRIERLAVGSKGGC